MSETTDRAELAAVANDTTEAREAASHAAPTFTPGPWTAKRQVSREGVSLGWIVDHANGRIGWSSYATATPNEGEGAPHTQGGINAHLIAAAPELYEALKNAVEIIQRYVDVDAMGIGQYEDTSWPLRDEYLSGMNKALAKAEGK